MDSIRLALAALLALACPSLFAQSADQQIVSVVDAPDPVVPGNNLVYTVTVRNNGPDAATNGGLNFNFDLRYLYSGATVPAGWSCARFGQAASCTTPSFAAGSTAVITITGQVDPSLLAFPDGTLSGTFSTSGTTPDPSNGNNSQGATTAYDSPQIDLSMVVSDTPDPVGPNGTITYTATVANAGPDPATNLNFNVFNNNTLRFQSLTVPAGWSCPTLPPVGGNTTLTCTRASFASGASSTFTLALLADVNVLGVNDGTVAVVFGTNGTGNDTNQNNNTETESTAYVTPDADLETVVTDTPDPAVLGATIQYVATFANTGPDPATNVNLNVFNNGSLRFQSVGVTGGANCATPPAVGATPTFTCTLASFPVGGSATMTLLARADATTIGPNGGTVFINFAANGAQSDPDNADNSKTEATLIVRDELLKDGFE